MFRFTIAAIVIAAVAAMATALPASAARPAADAPGGIVEDWGVYDGSMSPGATRGFSEEAWSQRSNPIGDNLVAVNRASTPGAEGWDIEYTSIIGQTIDEYGRCDVVANMIASVRIDRSTRAVTAAREDLGHVRGICDPVVF